MNISENLQRIQTAKYDIKNALNTKQNAGITDQKLDSYSNFVKTPSLNYYISDESKAVGAYGLLQDITSDGITWISGSATDIFQSATNTDVLCMKSSSSGIRNTGYLLFNLNKRYITYPNEGLQNNIRKNNRCLKSSYKNGNSLSYFLQISIPLTKSLCEARLLRKRTKHVFLASSITVLNYPISLLHTTSIAFLYDTCCAINLSTEKSVI